MPNRIAFSLGSLFVFLAYATYGAPAAAIVQVSEAVASSWNAKRPMKKAFNFGQLILSLAVFHLLYAHGFGSPAALSPVGALAWLVSGVSYYGINVLLVAGVIHLSARVSLRGALRELLADGYVGISGVIAIFLPLLYVFVESGWISLLLFCAGLLGFRYAVNLYLQQKQWSLDAIRQLTGLLERKTGAAESHALRVALLARKVAELLKLPPDDIDTVYAAGLLHDVGEVEIDPRIVTLMARKGVPTLADMETYKRHPELGERLIDALPGMTLVSAIIRHHHEAWDGSGYPDGLSGDQTPLLARIVAAAETIETTAEEESGQLTQISVLAGTLIDPVLAGPLEQALRSLNRSPLPNPAESTSEGILPQGVLQAIQGSRFMEKMGLARIFAYAAGRFTNLLGAQGEIPARADVLRFVQESLAAQKPVRQVVVVGETALDVYIIPTGTNSATVLLFDVTAALEMERDHVRRIFRAYRDVINVATQGKLLLVDDEGRNQLLQAGTHLDGMTLTQMADGAAARALVNQVGKQCGLDNTELFRLTVCASEAFGNVFKHAGHGSMDLRLHEGALRIIVRDDGSGIPYDILPHALLLTGFSTQKSLGKGFTLLLKYLDRVLLHTSPSGTVLVLEYAAKTPPVPPEAPAPPDQINDPGLRVTAGERNGRWTVTLAGPLAAETALNFEVTDPPVGVVTVFFDLAKLTLLDSTGVAALLRVARRSKSLGARVELLGPPATVRDVLDLTGFFDVLHAQT